MSTSDIDDSHHRGPWPIHDSVAETYTALGHAMDMIDCYGGIDGADHKQWVLDRVARLLLGRHYNVWCAERAADGYDWDCGIAP